MAIVDSGVWLWRCLAGETTRGRGRLDSFLRWFPALVKCADRVLQERNCRRAFNQCIEGGSWRACLKIAEGWSTTLILALGI